MNQLDYFKKYCSDRGLTRHYAFGHVDADGTKSLIFIDGFKSSHLAYFGQNLIHNQLYSVSSATCSNDSGCEVGKPKQNCVDTGLYSIRKCAVYFFKPIELDSFTYSFSFEGLVAESSFLTYR